MQSTSLLSNSFSAPCLRHEGRKSPREIPFLNQLNKAVSAFGMESPASIDKCFENVSFISRSRFLILACGLSLCSGTLQAQADTPIASTNGAASGSIDTTPEHDVRKPAVLKALAAVAEARRMIAIMEKINQPKNDITVHPAQANATNRLVKENEPNHESMAD